MIKEHQVGIAVFVSSLEQKLGKANVLLHSTEKAAAKVLDRWIADGKPEGNFLVQITFKPNKSLEISNKSTTETND